MGSVSGPRGLVSGPEQRVVELVGLLSGFAGQIDGPRFLVDEPRSQVSGTAGLPAGNAGPVSQPAGQSSGFGLPEIRGLGLA